MDFFSSFFFFFFFFYNRWFFFVKNVNELSVLRLFQLMNGDSFFMYVACLQQSACKIDFEYVNKLSSNFCLFLFKFQFLFMLNMLNIRYFLSLNIFVVVDSFVFTLWVICAAFLSEKAAVISFLHQTQMI